MASIKSSGFNFLGSRPTSSTGSSGGGRGGGVDYGNLFQQMQQRETSSIAANQQRLDQATAIYDEIISRYRPGGSFGKGYLAQLETQKVQDVGKSTQQQISSGLFGTTATSGLGSAWEANVGQPARLKLEDIQMERLSGAQRDKAGLIERVENPAPDYGMLFQAMQAQGQGGSGGGGGGGGFSVSGSVDDSSYMSRFNASRQGGGSGGGGGGGSTTPRGSSSFGTGGTSSGLSADFFDLGFEDDPKQALKRKKNKRQTIAGMYATQDYEDFSGAYTGQGAAHQLGISIAR